MADFSSDISSPVPKNMASEDPATHLDPRLDKLAHYNLDEVIQEILSFYNSLPHIAPSSIHEPHLGGWEMITSSNLAKHGIHKTDAALALLQRLPYLSGPQPWITDLALVCDYRLITISPTARDKPGWLNDAAEKWQPPWVILLTADTDREGKHYMLDTTDGTVSCYQNGGFEYPQAYAENDPRSWRDRPCDPETLTLKDVLDQWRGTYRDMEILGVPMSTEPWGSSPNPYWRGHEYYRCQEWEALHAIYEEHGWPHDYRKEACIQALRFWWTAWEARRHDDLWLSPEVFMESVKNAVIEGDDASQDLL